MPRYTKKTEDEIDLDVYEIDWWKIMPNSATIVIVGAPGTGKSNFIEYLVWQFRSKYPTIKIFDGSDEVDQRWRQYVPDTFISYNYSNAEMNAYVKRQKACIKDPNCINAKAICITNDCSDDPKIYKSAVITGKFKNGSRRYQNLDLYGMQYIVDMPPAIRKCISFSIIFKEDNPDERKKIYRTLSGGGLKEQEFYDLMDQLTGDYDYMVFNKRTQSSELEDIVFFGHAPEMDKMPTWKFGCNEIWEWNNHRIDHEKLMASA